MNDDDFRKELSSVSPWAQTWYSLVSAFWVLGLQAWIHHTWVLLLVLVCETVQLLNATAVKLYYLKQLLRSITLSSFLLFFSYVTIFVSLFPCPLRYPEFKFTFYLFLCYFTMLTDYVHFKELNVCVASHSTHMEVTWQPGIGSLLTQCRSRRSNLGNRLSGKHFYLVRHLIGPYVFFYSFFLM